MVEVKIAETKKVYGLTKAEKMELKKSLTLANPKYIAANRFSKYNRIMNIPPKLTYFDDFNDYIEIPTGYPLKLEYDTILDHRKVVTVSYPLIKIKLRDTQREAYREWLKDTDKGIICMSTGKGKSILGIYCAYALRQKTLVIVHKDDLVDVWKEDINLCFGGKLEHGLVKASKRVVGEQITIATIQTLSSMANKDLKAFNKFCKQFGMVIVDEMHHISSSIYNLINHFPAQYKIGLTATPERADGLSCVMYWYMGEMAYRYEYTAEDEDILPVRVHILESSFKYKPMCYVIPKSNGEFKYVLTSNMRSNGEYDEIPLEDVPIKKRPNDITYAYVDGMALASKHTRKIICDNVRREWKKGRSILLFFSQKHDCELYKTYLEAPQFKASDTIPPEHIVIYNGDQKRKALAQAREDIESGKVRITLATYSIATEGTNVKAWDTVFLCSSINNGKNVEQVVGRVRRAREGKPSTATVYDIRYPKCYMLKNHEWVRDKRYRSLKFKYSQALRSDLADYGRTFRRKSVKI